MQSGQWKFQWKTFSKALRASARSAICLLQLMVLFPHHVFATPSTIAAIEMDGLTTVEEHEVLATLPFAAGDPYSPTDLAAAVVLLRQWGHFTTVEATTIQRTDGVVIHLHFAEAQLIGEINIYGNYPFIQNRIRRNLSIRPGDPYDPATIEAQCTRLKDFYTREGYPLTEVTATQAWEPYTEDVRVDFHIKRGANYTLGRIRVRGNTAFPVGRFISVLNPWRQYTPTRLRESMTKMTALYHQRHYPKARIRVVEETPNPRFHEIDLVLEVNEGPHVNVHFVGNTHVNHHDCTNALTIFPEGRVDEFELEASAEALRTLYQQRGYPAAQVTSSRSTQKDGTIDITFTITEGLHQRVNRLEFAGNTAMGRGTLRKQMLTKPLSFFHKGILDPKLLEEDTKALEEFYKTSGYLDAHVEEVTVAPEVDPHFLVVTVPVAEGERYLTGEIRFDGNIHATHDALLQPMQLRLGHPYDPSLLSADREAIRLYYADHGYPYVDVQPTTAIDPTNHTIGIHYMIDEGPLVRIGPVIIIGDSLTSQKAIRSAMSIGPDEPYSEQKILASQLGIRRLGAFRTVSIETIGLKDHTTTVPLKVRVEEEKPFIIDLDAGYSTDQHLTGTLSFTNINSFGWAKRTQFRLTGGRRLSRGEIAWIDPRFFGHDLQWTTNAWVQYENKVAFAYLQTGSGIGLQRQFHRTGFRLRYSLERNYFLGGDSAAADDQSFRDNTISNISIGASFDTRNNFSAPTKGIYLSGVADFFNEIRGNRANFVRIQGGISQYWQIMNGLVLAQFGRLAGIQKLGNTVSVPSNKLFFLGGDETIRGFSEDRIGPTDADGRITGGLVRWIYNAELSANLFRGFQLATFFDIGSLTNAFREITKDSTRESIGVGIRYVTPVGPIRADYGFKLDRKAGENVGRFHFTFGHIF